MAPKHCARPCSMNQTTILLTIAAMSVVTYLPRVLPALLLSSRRLPPLAEAWLRYVPAAVLGALVLPALMENREPGFIPATNLYVWAAVPTVVVAWKTRSLIGAVAAGVAVVALARLGLGYL